MEIGLDPKDSVIKKLWCMKSHTNLYSALAQLPLKNILSEFLGAGGVENLQIYLLCPYLHYAR